MKSAIRYSAAPREDISCREGVGGGGDDRERDRDGWMRNRKGLWVFSLAASLPSGALGAVWQPHLSSALPVALML